MVSMTRLTACAANNARIAHSHKREYTMNEFIQLSDAIDQGLATLGWNSRPDGWREANFEGLLAYVAPECPEILGEEVE